VLVILVFLLVAVAGWFSAPMLAELLESRGLLWIALAVAIVGVTLRWLGFLHLGIFGDPASNIGIALLAAAVFWLAGAIRVERYGV